MLKLIKDYAPLWSVYQHFKQGTVGAGGYDFCIALERGDGEIKRHDIRLFAYPDKAEENFNYAERVVKFMLWAFGGYRYYFSGNDELANRIKALYVEGGERAFDYEYMSNIYRHPMEFLCVKKEEMPKECDKPISCEGSTKGNRIGFDAGGSDRKVTAIKDGVTVFEDETVWQPKIESNPEYHRAGIDDSINRALASLGNQVDHIGVSSAGIIINGEVRVASLFRKVPTQIYEKEIFPIYTRLSDKYGCPVKVANDGDVTALAGANQLGKGKVLGIAMGTSLAGGYIDGNMRIRGYLNELAFVPVDADKNGAVDEWSGDYGVGGVYHSQDGVIRLAEQNGLDLSSGTTLGEKLKIVQSYANDGDKRALEVYEELGKVFGYSILWFSTFYEIDYVMFLGRVASGKGGDLLFDTAKAVLKDAGSKIALFMPDEMTRRLGQSYTAGLM